MRKGETFVSRLQTIDKKNQDDTVTPVYSPAVLLKTALKNLVRQGEAEMDEKKIVLGIFSGTIFGGKSTTMDYVCTLQEYTNTKIIKMDEVRMKVFKNSRLLTKSEHVFKNEATRFELKAEIISQRPVALFSEMVMLTKDAHQKPLVEMVNDTNQYLRKIRGEEDALGSDPKPSELDLRVVLFFCDEEAVNRRIKYRDEKMEKEGEGGLFHITWEQWIDHLQEFEIPTDYKPLLVDTSDESEEGLASNRQEVLSFLNGKTPISEYIYDQRREKLQNIITVARQ